MLYIDGCGQRSGAVGLRKRRQYGPASVTNSKPPDRLEKSTA